uniref:G_PROTEIN_RECEP_F1_2 domain-containing protein n=1 Tax=Panagrellus redivivus TaxID=6233 RepID=A0A7E4VHA1_PANRE
MAFVLFYQCFHYTLGVLTLIVAPIFAVTMVKKSASRMSSYKKLMSIIMVSSVISTGITATSVPVFNSEKMVYEFHGFFKLVENYYSVIVAAVITVSGTINTDLLLVILINRFDNVSTTIAPKSRTVIYSIYALIAITSFLECAQLVILIAQSELPLALRPFRRMVNKVYHGYTLLFLISRLIGFIVIVCLNIRFGRRFMKNASSKVVRLHRMLTRATIANVICAAVFTQIPMLIVVAAIISRDKNFIDTSVNIMTALQSFAFFADMVTTLYFVKPFREYLLKLLKYFKVFWCMFFSVE